MGFSLASTFSRAMSEVAVPAHDLRREGLAAFVPTSTSSRPWTTWYAVTTCPWSSQTTPVPFLPSELTLTTEGLTLSATSSMALENVSSIPDRSLYCSFFESLEV